MEPFVDNSPLWDLSHSSSFSQLADDDFLALLQKQFPTEPTPLNTHAQAINPQNISRYSHPSMTPPSEDSSPSPPNLNDLGNDEASDPALKRKASDDSMEGGPSQKSQHTGTSFSPRSIPTTFNVCISANSRKSSTASRRKSTGASGPVCSFICISVIEVYILSLAQR